MKTGRCGCIAGKNETKQSRVLFRYGAKHRPNLSLNLLHVSVQCAFLLGALLRSNLQHQDNQKNLNWNLNPVDLGRYSVSKREIYDLDLYDCWKVFDDVCQVSPLVVGLFSL